MAKPMRIGVLTTGRQDWGILRSTCASLRSDASFELTLLTGGMANSATHGAIVELIEADGFVVADRLDWLGEGEASATDQAARALQMVGHALERHPVDALVLVGDRFETMSAAVAATLARLPIVHLHGGEETEGAFDNAIRHAITKLAHLHLVSHPDYARRVVSMGEDPRTVHVVGAPGLDNLRRELPSRLEVEARLGAPLGPPVVVVTLHPATLGADADVEASAVVEAMDSVEATYVVTLPNNDPGAAKTRAALMAAVDARPARRVAVEALGERFYWGLLCQADAMLGNSSSALLEGPSLGLPAVNVGARQRGRLRAPTVLDVEPVASEISAALGRALSPSFRESVGAEARTMYGDGNAAARIIEVLRAWIPPSPPVKRAWSPADV